MTAELGGILQIRQCKKLCYQLVALSLCDKLGGRDRIHKNLKFRQLINVPVIIVLVLRGLIVLNMKTAVVEHSKIIADGIPGNTY